MTSPSSPAADALFDHAVRAYRAGRAREAEAHLERVIAADPRRHEALHLLGLIAYEDGRFQQSIAMLQRALQGNRKSPDCQSALGAALLATGSIEDAVKCLRRVVALRPADSSAHSNLGEALRRLGSVAEAEASLRRAIALNPLNGDACYNLGGLLAETGREMAAAPCLERAVELTPEHAEAHSNLGIVREALGRTGEAIASFRRAVEIAPQTALYRLHLAYALLATGALDEGWREHEQRFGAGTKVLARRFPHPHWQGEPLDGRSLLVWMEQGIGDELMFASLLPELVARAGRCVVECAPKLVSLFQRSFPGALVVPRSDPPDARTLSDIDVQVAAGSAARWLRDQLEKFPAAAGYLHPDPSRVAWWRQRVGAVGPGLKVGFSWRSAIRSGRRALDCTRIEQWGPILATPGATFVCLQYDECAAELASARARFGTALHAFPEVDLFNDLHEAAALTRALDVVITIHSSVSVLAAGLGVETWRLNYLPDWRTLGTNHVPWHPGLARFDRVPGQPWEEIIAAVAAQLAERV